MVCQILMAPTATVLLYGILPLPAWMLGIAWVGLDVAGAARVGPAASRACVGRPGLLPGARRCLPVALGRHRRLLLPAGAHHGRRHCLCRALGRRRRGSGRVPALGQVLAAVLKAHQPHAVCFNTCGAQRCAARCGSVRRRKADGVVLGSPRGPRASPSFACAAAAASACKGHVRAGPMDAQHVTFA